jgi:hypothetical protein
MRVSSSPISGSRSAQVHEPEELTVVNAAAVATASAESSHEYRLAA